MDTPDFVEQEVIDRQKLTAILNRIKRSSAQRGELIHEAFAMASSIDRKYSRNYTETKELWCQVRESTWR